MGSVLYLNGEVGWRWGSWEYWRGEVGRRVIVLFIARVISFAALWATAVDPRTMDTMTWTSLVLWVWIILEITGWYGIKSIFQESRRQAAAEAAERRAQTQGSRGIQDPSRVQRMQERSLEVERLEREAAKTGDTGPTLRVRDLLGSWSI